MGEFVSEGAQEWREEQGSGRRPLPEATTATPSDRANELPSERTLRTTQVVCRRSAGGPGAAATRRGMGAEPL